MNKFLIGVLVFVLLSSVCYGGSFTMAVKSGEKTSSTAITTFANSQVDTIIIQREKEVVSLSFAIIVGDSAQFHSTTAGLVRRVIGGKFLSLAADTLINITNQSIVAAGGVYASNVVISSTTQPLPEQFYIIITYASANCGVTTPTLQYRIEKNYYYAP